MKIEFTYGIPWCRREDRTGFEVHMIGKYRWFKARRTLDIEGEYEHPNITVHTTFKRSDDYKRMREDIRRDILEQVCQYMSQANTILTEYIDLMTKQSLADSRRKGYEEWK
jgi:hypothetical protein